MLGFKPMIIPNIWGCETWVHGPLLEQTLVNIPIQYVVTLPWN